jgi:hypothetical protein
MAYGRGLMTEDGKWKALDSGQSSFSTLFCGFLSLFLAVFIRKSTRVLASGDILRLEQAPIQLALSYDGAQRSRFQILMQRNGQSDSPRRDGLLHNSMATFLTNLRKAMFFQ